MGYRPTLRSPHIESTPRWVVYFHLNCLPTKEPTINGKSKDIKWAILCPADYSILATLPDYDLDLGSGLDF